MRQTIKKTKILIGLLILLIAIGAGDLESNAAAQAGREPTIVLPVTRYASADAISSRNIVVSVASENEFYVGRIRVPKENLAVTIRDAMVDKRVDEQDINIRCGDQIQFGAVRELLNVIRQIGYDRLNLVVNGPEPSRAEVLKAQIITPNGIKVDPRDVITLPPPPTRKSTQKAPPPPPPPPSSVRVVKTSPLPPFGEQGIVVETRTGSSKDQLVAVNTRAMPLGTLRRFLGRILEQIPDKIIFVKPSRD